MGIYNGEKKTTVSNETLRQTFMDNEVEEDRERDGPTSSSTTSRTCGSRWRTWGIVLNGEGEPVWLPPTRGIHSLKERERGRMEAPTGHRKQHGIFWPVGPLWHVVMFKSSLGAAQHALPVAALYTSAVLRNLNFTMLFKRLNSFPEQKIYARNPHFYRTGLNHV